MDTSARTNTNISRHLVTSKSAPSRSCPDTVFSSATSHSNSEAPPAIPAKSPARQRASLVIDIYKEPTYAESIAPSFRADRASSQSYFLSDELELKIDQLVWEIENMGPSKNPARLSRKLTDLVLDIYQKPPYSSIVPSEDSFNPSSQSDFLSDELEKKIDELVLEIQNMAQPINEETTDGEISSHELQNDQAWVESMESDSEIAEPEPKVEMLEVDVKHDENVAKANVGFNNASPQMARDPRVGIEDLQGFDNSDKDTAIFVRSINEEQALADLKESIGADGHDELLRSGLTALRTRAEKLQDEIGGDPISVLHLTINEWKERRQIYAERLAEVQRLLKETPDPIEKHIQKSLTADEELNISLSKDSFTKRVNRLKRKLCRYPKHAAEATRKETPKAIGPGLESPLSEEDCVIMREKMDSVLEWLDESIASAGERYGFAPVSPFLKTPKSGKAPGRWSSLRARIPGRKSSKKEAASSKRVWL